MLIKKIIICLLLFTLTYVVAKKKKSEPVIWPPVVRAGKGIIYNSIYNDTGRLGYYHFRNIQYGRVLDRFSAPSPVCEKSCKKFSKVNLSISKWDNSGRMGGHPICPQAVPDWFSNRNTTYYEKIPYRAPNNEVEDCLFLDVIVPRKIWEKTHNFADRGFAPVLVWIHGGGFTSGDRSLKIDPSIVLARSLEFHEGGVIVVSINYRLGLFGFLAGDDNIVSNAGLLDQRMALGWVQNHIQRFGGDRYRVTVVGEGAGAGSIMNHIAALNISKRYFPQIQSPLHHHRHYPFRSAILQSPVFQPIVGSQSRYTLEKVLRKASEISGQEVTNVAILRKLPYKTLYDVNTALVQQSAYGTFTFGPSVNDVRDNKSYIPDFPLKRLKAGRIAKGVNIFVGYRRNEGRSITPSTMNTDEGFQSHLADIFPTVARRDINYISDSLYPSSDYDTIDQGGMNRSIEAIEDIFVGCNVYYLLKYISRSYGYVTDTAWSIQDQFLMHALFEGGTVAWGNSRTKMVAQWWQDQFLLFGMFATQGARTAKLRAYDGSGKVMFAKDDGFGGYIDNPTSKHQCRYWASVPYEIAS